MVPLKQHSLSVKSAFYGSINGSDISYFTLRNKDVEIIVSNLGCAIVSIITPDKNGIKKNIVAGFKELSSYADNPDYFGVALGRYANRIANGQFKLDGRLIQLSVNDGVNHLHGGTCGFSKKVWDTLSTFNTDDEAGIEFGYRSRDGEEGYPGNLEVKITYRLTPDNCFHISYWATTDMQTPVNLSNHSYFNLTGFDDPLITSHILQINATTYTEQDSGNIPTGKINCIINTPLDFSLPKKIGGNIDSFPVEQGFNHNYIVDSNNAIPAAILMEEVTGRILRIFTNQPALQLYTANWWNGSITGRQNVPYVRHGAVALETQAYPDSPNHANFPDTILDVGSTYSTTTMYQFGLL